jgi:hypothetical protein
MTAPKNTSSRSQFRSNHRTYSKKQQLTLVNYLDALENWGEKVFFNNAPKISSKIHNFILKFLPFLIILIVVFFIPLLLKNLPSVVKSVFTFNITKIGSFFGVIVNLFSMILLSLSIPGIFKKYRGSWKLVFYSSLLSLTSIVFVKNITDIITFVLITCSLFFILFQIKKDFFN